MKTLQEVRKEIAQTSAELERVSLAISEQRQILNEAFDVSKVEDMQRDLEDASAAAALGDAKAAQRLPDLQARLAQEKKSIALLKDGFEQRKVSATALLAGLERLYNALTTSANRLAGDEQKTITDVLETEIRALADQYHSLSGQLAAVLARLVAYERVSQQQGAHPVRAFTNYGWDLFNLPRLAVTGAVPLPEIAHKNWPEHLASARLLTPLIEREEEELRASLSPVTPVAD